MRVVVRNLTVRMAAGESALQVVVYNPAVGELAALLVACNWAVGEPAAQLVVYNPAVGESATRLIVCNWAVGELEVYPAAFE